MSLRDCLGEPMLRFLAEVVELRVDELTMEALVEFDDQDHRLNYMVRARADEYRDYKLPHPVTTSAMKKLSELLKRWREDERVEEQELKTI